MNKEKQRDAIAEFCEWIYDEATQQMVFIKDGDIHGIDWPSLDAMHEAEKSLVIDQLWRMDFELAKLCGVSGGHGSGNHHEWTWHATADQREEAMVRAIGKWEDEQ